MEVHRRENGSRLICYIYVAELCMLHTAKEGEWRGWGALGVEGVGHRWRGWGHKWRGWGMSGGGGER